MSFRMALIIVAGLAFGLTQAHGRLPPPTEEQKLKAEETKAKSAEQPKRDAESPVNAQDEAAARYIQQMKAEGIDVKPTSTAPPVTPAAAPAPTQAGATPPAELAPRK